MSAPVIQLAPSATVADVIDLVSQTGHNGFPVVKDDKIVGIITSTDLISAKQDEKIEAYMTKDLLRANPDDDIVSIAGIMAFNHIHHVPVTEDDDVVGIVTATDMLRASIENIISENVARIFTFFQTLHPNIRLGHTRVAVASLVPTQKLLDPAELRLREAQFKRGVVYPIVVTKKGNRTYIIDGHHRAYLASKLKIKKMPAFYIEDGLGIIKSSAKLGLTSLQDMVVVYKD